MTASNNAVQTTMILDALKRTQSIDWPTPAGDAKQRTVFLDEFLLNYIEIHGDDHPDFFSGALLLLEDIKRRSAKLRTIVALLTYTSTTPKASL